MMHTLMDRSKLCAVARTSSGRKGQWRMVVIAKDEANAKAVETAFRKRVTEMGTEFTAAENLPNSARAARDTMKAMRLRALRAVPIKVEGDRVVIDLAIEPTDEEAKALAPYLEERKALAAKAAAVVRALKDGKVPPAELLQAKTR
jgi:transcription-repair coupling factor (superfamily II helicase)